MFDLGFWEFLLIMIVALLVIGPERLPAVARQAGKWFSKTKRFVSSVQEDINEELQMEEWKRLMRESDVTRDIKEATDELNESTSDLRRQVSFDEEVGTATGSSKRKQGGSSKVDKAKELGADAGPERLKPSNSTSGDASDRETDPGRASTHEPKG